MQARPEIRWLILAVICLPLIACFEDPVQEHIHLSLRGNGPVVVTVIQKIAPSERAEKNAELADRLDDSRDTVDQGLDPWSGRIALLEPLAERETAETVAGELRRVIHSAVLDSFSEVLPLLEADGLTGDLDTSGRVAELRLFPTGGSRATAIQRQEAERRLAEWSGQLARYFEATAELYAYLENRPERAAPCLAHIFDSHEDNVSSGPLSSEEEELVAQTKTEMELVVGALLVPTDSAFSLNELTRLVYDPFPARLTLAVAGQVVENEGFISTSGVFERPSVDAWTALRSLEGRWIEPDLVTAMVSPAPEDRQPEPDVAAIATLRRFWSTPPTPAEIEDALLTRLQPEDLLLLRWKPAVRDDGTDSSEAGWISIMADAEASIPD